MNDLNSSNSSPTSSMKNKSQVQRLQAENKLLKDKNSRFKEEVKRLKSNLNSITSAITLAYEDKSKPLS